MPTLNVVLTRGDDLEPTDVEWLHLLVGDWQLVSDLSFADLVLWVRSSTPAGPTWIVASQVRPNTGPLVFFDDLVGSEVGPERRALLDQCAAAGRIVRDPRAEWRDDAPLREEAVPVIRKGRVIGVLTRHSNLATMRTPSRLEITYRSTADTLARMIGAGEFPKPGTPAGHRSGAPRVGDGVVRLDVDGVVTYASPNAVSALHRLGHHAQIVGEYLSRITTDCLEADSVVDEALPLVVTGKAPWPSEVDAQGASLTMRAIPLTEAGERIGALILLRDVSELRRQERALLTKDATIREIHHRVKNNLQTVAALLRLQSRRVPDEQAKAALAEAERRVATIALVHDTLSRTLDEVVDFDEIVARSLQSVIEIAARVPGSQWELQGRFGKVAAEDANALAMIVTELVHNAVEHGLTAGGGLVRINAERAAVESSEWGELLTVTVEDDGAGLPADFRPGRSGLGTQIVTALVQDLRGSISWQTRPGGGTIAQFVARLRRVKETS